MLLAVANEIPYVHKRAVEVRPDGAPGACSGRDDHAQAGVGVWGNNALVTGLRIVIPGNSDHVFGKNGQQFGILDRDISPEHELLVIRLHDLENFLQVFEIDAAETLLGRQSLRLSEPKFESFVGPNVEERARKQGSDLAVDLPNEIVAFGIGRSEHVTVGRLGEIGVDFVLQKLMNMSEGLLLGQEGDVVLAGVVDQLFDLGGS